MEGAAPALYRYMRGCARPRARDVKALVRAGADPNFAGELGQTPLHVYLHASGRRDVRVLRALLKAGAFVDVRDRCCGATPLHLYLRHAEVDLRVLKRLLAGRRRAPGGARLRELLCSLLRDYALTREPPLERVMRFLIRRGADINDLVGEGFGTLLHACLEGPSVRFFAVRALLRLGARVDARDAYRMTPLAALVSSPNASVEVVNLLVAWGADPRAVDCRGNTLLHYHAQSRRPRAAVARRLIALGCDPRAPNSAGNLPLHVLAMRASCRRSMLHPLLEAGLDVDAPNTRHRTTPLHAAAGFGNAAACARLLAQGASPVARALSGGTPLTAMVVNGLEAAVRRALALSPPVGAVVEALAAASAHDEFLRVTRGAETVRLCVAYVVLRRGPAALPAGTLRAHAAHAAACAREAALLRRARCGQVTAWEIAISAVPLPTTVPKKIIGKISSLRIYGSILLPKIWILRKRMMLINKLIVRIGTVNSLTSDAIEEVLMRLPTSSILTALRGSKR